MSGISGVNGITDTDSWAYEFLMSKRWQPGTFFSAENFTVRAYMEHYKEHMINYSCEFTTIGKFAASHRQMHEIFFVRPVKDLKEFAGDVMEFDEIVRWERKIRYLPGCDNNPTLSTDTEIAVSEPCGISHEWRVFVVNGQVSSGSHYREYMTLTPRAELPIRVIEFVENMCQIWTPADVFVMDVGESAGELYVVECNCFNSAGFYKSNVEKIVTQVSEFVSGVTR